MFDINNIRQRIFSYPMMSKMRLLHYIDVIDKLIDDALSEVDKHTNYYNRALSDILGYVSGYNTCKYYTMPTMELRRKHLRDECIINDPDCTRVLDTNMQRMVIETMQRLNSSITGMRAARENVPLIRGMRYDLLTKFIAATAQYREMTAELVHLLATNSDMDRELQLRRHLHDIEQQMHSGNTLEYVAHTACVNQTRVIALQQRIVESYAKKTWTIALDFAGHSQAWVLRYFQSGMVGLTKSILYYDADKGQNFGTYAECWIRQEILSDIRRNNIVSEAPTTLARRSKVSRVVKSLEADGIEPTVAKVAKIVKLKQDRVQELMRLNNDIKPVSMQTPISDDGNAKLEDVLAYEPEVVEDMEVVTELINRLHTMDATLARIFALSCGCENVKKLSPDMYIRLAATQLAATRRQI